MRESIVIHILGLSITELSVTPLLHCFWQCYQKVHCSPRAKVLSPVLNYVLDCVYLIGRSYLSHCFLFQSHPRSTLSSTLWIPTHFSPQIQVSGNLLET